MRIKKSANTYVCVEEVQCIYAHACRCELGVNGKRVVPKAVMRDAECGELAIKPKAKGYRLEWYAGT